MRTITLFKTVVLILILAFSVSAQKSLTPAELVYPQLDSENSRWIFFSSACRPFGMVNLCPDTRTNGDWGSGYHYEVDTIRGFSHIHEWQLSGLSMMPGGIMSRAGYEHKTELGGGLKYYIEKGYVPFPLPDGNFGMHQDGAGMTLEYAYQDWTLAQMAKALGHAEDYGYFMKRSQNYQNLFDPETGWIRPKNVDGKWYAPFDPFEINHGFIEANSAQSTWFVPQDLPGLARLMGGNDAAIKKLVQSFETAQKLGFTSGDSHSQELHPEYSRIPINYGNEPSIQTAYIFNLLGKPNLTQYWSREVVNAAFSGLSPSTGYNGDEDQGLMGTLAVLYKIGLFQMNGGTEKNPRYELGSPIFDQITIRLHPKYYPGKLLTIKTIGNSDKNRYILSADFNGKKIDELSLKHQDLVKGGLLTLKMGERLSK